MALISARPVSTPTGFAPALHSLMPLYLAADHIRALRRRAAADRVGQRTAARAHVVQRDDGLRVRQPHERRADRLGDRLVKLVRHDPPDVVCLEDLLQIAHCRLAS